MQCDAITPHSDLIVGKSFPIPLLSQYGHEMDPLVNTFFGMDTIGHLKLHTLIGNSDHGHYSVKNQISNSIQLNKTNGELTSLTEIQARIAPKHSGASFNYGSFLLKRRTDMTTLNARDSSCQMDFQGRCGWNVWSGATLGSTVANWRIPSVAIFNKNMTAVVQPAAASGSPRANVAILEVAIQAIPNYLDLSFQGRMERQGLNSSTLGVRCKPLFFPNWTLTASHLLFSNTVHASALCLDPSNGSQTSVSGSITRSQDSGTLESTVSCTKKYPLKNGASLLSQLNLKDGEPSQIFLGYSAYHGLGRLTSKVGWDRKSNGLMYGLNLEVGDYD